jgi:hypothetical protein
MAFEPRTGNGGERERKEKQVECPLHSLRRDAHPARNRRRVRMGIDHPPKHAHHDNRKHAHSQRLVELPVEIAGGRVHALLGSSRAIDERDQDENRRDPMEGLRDGPVSAPDSVASFVPLHKFMRWLLRSRVPSRKSRRAPTCHTKKPLVQLVIATTCVFARGVAALLPKERLSTVSERLLAGYGIDCR